MNLISIYGAGLLVGAAIIIIVPEAIQVILNSYGNSSHQTNFQMGITVLAGFSVMLIIDEVFKMLNTKKESKEAHEEPLLLVTERVHGPHHHHAHVHHHEARSVSITATALVVQASCDGVALGASLFLQSTGRIDRLGVLLFIGICLQKAPTALGYGTFLQHAGLEKKQVVNHMLVFTLTAPILCMLTFFILTGKQEPDIKFVQWLAGVFLLFSAGAFIYVATIHILPEVYCSEQAESPGRDHQDIDRAHISKEHGSKACELLTLMMGLFTPMLLEMAF